MTVPKNYIIIFFVLLIILLIIFLLKLFVFKDKNTEIFTKLNKLKNYTAPDGSKIDLHCEPLSGVKRVYVSAGMFDLTDNIYSIGIGGLMSGTGFSAMAFPEIICGLSDEQIKELQEYCVTWAVPWYGIVGEIEKMGWEAYCPVRDGFVMAPTIAATLGMTIDELYKTSTGENAGNNSMFNKNVIKNNIKNDENYKNLLALSNQKLDFNNISDTDCLTYIKWYLSRAISLSIGVNDLFAMYSSCNCCVFNENGLQADSGGLAELGNLGARGVPITIIKSQITADFSGSNNPMPTMCSSAQSTVYPTLLSQNKNTLTPYRGMDGALTHLKEKIDLMSDNVSDPYKYGNANYTMPLPPLQTYWSTLGALSYFLKHKSKRIKTTGENKGQINYKEDYTDFWLNNVVKAKDKNKGFLSFAKKCGENFYMLQKDKNWQTINDVWS